jgi:pimeloyl-ACP methyl ester carboxylesterase
MKTFRTWGKPPYKVAVVHGGPGAPGYLWSVAGDLSRDTGVLEPLQTRNSLAGQVAELAAVLQQQADLPVVLVGHSWGAMLGYIVTARYPALVKKLVMVGSGPYEQQYAENIDAVRLERLSEAERVEEFNLVEIINSSAPPGEKDRAVARSGELLSKADTYAPLPPEKEPEPLPVSEEINRLVWAEARQLRISGGLLDMGKQIKCPVVAIHGDYDPHPAEGVRMPLSRVLQEFRFIRLEKCGHYPWRERFARDAFYKVLKNELK